eukprot:scaffold25305_cov67-Phaeocystis_antarctica.AAC.3
MLACCFATSTPKVTAFLPNEDVHPSDLASCQHPHPTSGAALAALPPPPPPPRPRSRRAELEAAALPAAAAAALPAAAAAAVAVVAAAAVAVVVAAVAAAAPLLACCFVMLICAFVVLACCLALLACCLATSSPPLRALRDASRQHPYSTSVAALTAHPLVLQGDPPPSPQQPVASAAPASPCTLPTPCPSTRTLPSFGAGYELLFDVTQPL